MIEWLPFIEAYARLGQWDKAEALAQAAVDADGRVRKGVCQVWGRIRSATGTPPEGQARSEKLLTNFACGK